MATEEQYDKDTRDSKLIIDHDYDGIKELDNPPPSWLMIIFYGTIIWSIFYIYYYHVFDGQSQEEEYLTEMQEAKSNTIIDTFDESDLRLLADATDISEGERFYESKNCNQCHGITNIGPDLTDEYWLHGGDIKEVFKSIKYGIPEKGMISYKDQMTDKQIQQTASFIIIKMKGAQTKNTKGPEGTK